MKYDCVLLCSWQAFLAFAVVICLETERETICTVKSEIFSQAYRQTPVSELCVHVADELSEHWLCFFTLSQSSQVTFIPLVSHSCWSRYSWHKRWTYFLDTFLPQLQRFRNSRTHSQLTRWHQSGNHWLTDTLHLSNLKPTSPAQMFGTTVGGSVLLTCWLYKLQAKKTGSSCSCGVTCCHPFPRKQCTLNSTAARICPLSYYSGIIMTLSISAEEVDAQPCCLWHRAGCWCMPVQSL